ncbi:MAG: sugar ABC transporter permease, partial [Agathobacter sp.]|nr:sugar ABC transporter permease [Agathobacter sp.]
MKAAIKNLLQGLKKFFADFGNAITKGDIWTRLSLIIMGAGYFGRKQFIKGILMTVFEILCIVTFTGFCLPYLLKFDTLGDVERVAIFDPITMT